MFSHTMDLVGSRFSTRTLGEFVSVWISVFSRLPKSRLIWKTQTGRAVQNYSKTRWWSHQEVMHQIMQQFGDIELFLRKMMRLHQLHLQNYLKL